MGIDPRALKRFLAVCEEGSIGAAARRLHVTQPAVSATIGQLEEVLKTTLFTRARSGITLTNTGVILRRKAEALEVLLNRAEREVALVQIDIAGPMVVGGTPGALASLVPRAVAIILQEFPSFDLQVLERPDNELSEMLRTGQIDLAIVTTGIVAASPDLVEEAIMRDPFTLLVGQQNEHLPEKVTLSALQNARWVLPDVAGAFRRQVDALFLQTNTPMPANVIRCDSLLTTKAIVRETDYVTILPREVAAAELSVGFLRAIPIEGSFLRYVGVRMLADNELSTFANMFLTALRSLEPTHNFP